MNILITGISGFIGGHLLNYLRRNDLFKDFCPADRRVSNLPGLNSEETVYPIIIGVDYSDKGISFQKDGHKLQIKDNVFTNGFTADNAGDLVFIEADLRDKSKIERIIKKYQPGIIYHLAAQSSVKYSWDNPVETMEINVFGGINLFEAVKKYTPDCKVLVTCTAEEYYSQSVMDACNVSINEDSRIFPANPYAISKAALDFFSFTYFRSWNLKIFVTRSFNHLGPGQSERFVASDFARQIVEIEKGRAEPVIGAGNLDVSRDFLDVRDAVRAYACILEKGRPGQAYNVCSGKEIKIANLLDILISFSSCKNISVKIIKEKLRPIDTLSIYGNNSKLIKDTGWFPEYKLEKSLLDTLNWWRERSQ